VITVSTTSFPLSTSSSFPLASEYHRQEKSQSLRAVEQWDTFFEALVITSANKQLNRFIFTTGLKQYAVHQDQPKNPMHQTDQWLDRSDRGPNFYYGQQKTLAKAAKEQGWELVVTYPQDAIGFVKAYFMNLATALGL
jgi:hypothetical protein